MKVFIISYDVVCQNESGGVQVRIKNYLEHASKYIDVKLFDIWNDKLIDCDILHVFKANIDTYALMVQAKKKGKKIILSSVIPQEKPFVVRFNLLCSKLLRLQTGYLIFQKELLMADHIIAQTTQEKNFIVRNYKVPGSKISVIPNGVSINFKEENRNALSEKYQIDQKYLLQVGRFDENKNQLSVIRALKGTGIKTLFVGGPDPQSSKYYEQCKSEATDEFTFLGWLENGSPELQSAYLNAQAVILPSHKEIFGNSLVEAGAAGANLIATKSLPLHSMGIEKYCRTIDPNDIDDIRNKIIEAMHDEKIRDQCEEFISLFSWEAVTQKHLDIYKRIIGI